MSNRQQRLEEVFKRIGNPNAGQMATQTAVGSSSGVYGRIKQLQQGAFRNEVKNAITAKSPGQQAAELKVPKPRRNPNQRDPQKTMDAPTLQSYTPKNLGGDFSTIESMFSEKPVRHSYQSNSEIPTGELVNYDAFSARMPDFDIHAELKRKMQNKGQQVPTTDSQYMQYASTSPGLDMSVLEDLLAEMAEKTARETVKSMMREYVTKSKNKEMFNWVNKGMGIIEIDGKNYLIKQVTIKKSEK